MSRIPRALIRRDRAWCFMEKLEEDEENTSLNIKQRLTELFKDIPSEKIGPVPPNLQKKNYEWHAICIGARIASIAGIWDVPVQDLEKYLPSIEYRTFKHNWEQLRKNNLKDAHDFLKLLNMSVV